MKPVLRHLKKREEAVSPVIATILMVAITVVLAGVLGVTISSFTKPPAGSNVVVALVPTSFVNPSEDIGTNNSHGWSIAVNSVEGGKANIVEVEIVVKTSAGTVLARVKPGAIVAPDLSFTAGTTPYYIDVVGTCGYDATVGGVNEAAVACSANIAGTGFQTVQGVAIIFLDNNKDGEVSGTDTVLVFKDNNADGTIDIAGGKVDISLGKSTIGSATL